MCKYYTCLEWVLTDHVQPNPNYRHRQPNDSCRVYLFCLSLDFYFYFYFFSVLHYKSKQTNWGEDRNSLNCKFVLFLFVSVVCRWASDCVVGINRVNGMPVVPHQPVVYVTVARPSGYFGWDRFAFFYLLRMPVSVQTQHFFLFFLLLYSSSHNINRWLIPLS